VTEPAYVSNAAAERRGYPNPLPRPAGELEQLMAAAISDAAIVARPVPTACDRRHEGAAFRVRPGAGFQQSQLAPEIRRVLPS
jgi:hypothetical protein